MKRSITLSCDDDSLIPSPWSDRANSLALGIGCAVLATLCNGDSPFPADVQRLLRHVNIEVDAVEGRDMEERLQASHH